MEKWIPNFCRSLQQYLAVWWIVLWDNRVIKSTRNFFMLFSKKEKNMKVKKYKKTEKNGYDR